LDYAPRASMFRALPGHCLHLLRLLAISISFQMKRFRLTRGCGLVSHVPDDGFLCCICTCRIVEAAEGGDRTSIAPNRLLAARQQQPNCGLTAVNHWEFEGRPGSIPIAPLQSSCFPVAPPIQLRAVALNLVPHVPKPTFREAAQLLQNTDVPR